MKVKVKKIKRIEDEPGLLCVDDCIATIAAYYDRNYELIYSDGIKIDILDNKDKNTIKQYVDIISINRVENLFKYHGVGLEIISNDAETDLREVIIKQIEEERPVMVHFDTYWCPWDLGFQKFSSECGHHFIIVDTTEEGFICVDPYFEIEAVKLPNEYFYKGIKNIFVTDCYDTLETIECDYSAILNNIRQNYLLNGFTKCLEDIINFFDNSSREEIFIDVIEDENLWSNHVIVLMMQVNQSMLVLAILLEYLADNCDVKIAKRLASEIRNLTIQWKQVRKLVVKLYFIRKENDLLKASIVNKMKSIQARFAEFIAGLGIEMIDDVEINKKEEMEEISCNYIKLQMKEYFNNCAFTNWKCGKLENPLADFSSIGNCYIADKSCFLIPEERQAMYNFEAIFENTVDNVSCDGQCINVEPRKYTKMSIVGVAEFGNSIEIIDVIGAKEKLHLEVGFTDYIFLPQNGESIIWKGKGVHKSNDKETGIEFMKEELYLMEKTYEIDFDDRIRKIVLPINPSIHIFAITLM